jgi:hypothetical protein
MRRSDDLITFLLRKYRRPELAIAAGAAALLCAASGAQAGSSTATQTAVKLLATIPVPVAKTNTTGGLYGFDISWVDQSTQTYYLGDRSNAAVDVVNAANGTFVTQVLATPPFAGATGNNSTSGPNGVTSGAVAGQVCLFAGDAGGRVVSFMVPSYTQVSSVLTGGTFRADEMAFDPKNAILIVVNNADTPPFASLIAVGPGCTLTVSRKIIYTFATNGAEQSIWNPTDDRFYESIPSISGTTASPGPEGAIIRINPTTGVIERTIPVFYCQPAGLTLGPDQNVLGNCSQNYDTAGNEWTGTDPNTATPFNVIVDLRTGLVTYVPGAGAGDEAFYNAGDNHYYSASSTSPWAPSVVVPGATAVEQGAAILAVIDASSMTLDQSVPTFNVPATATHVSGASHSVAANAANSLVFVPHPANNALPGCLTGCIGLYGRSDPSTD